MKSKLFLFPIFIILSVLLASSVSAIVVYGDWEDGNQNIQIDEGGSVNFNADFFSMTLPMTINIKLYDSEYTLVHSFESDKVVNTYGYYNVYTITEDIYNTAGNFEIILTGSDAFPGSDSHTIFLTVEDVLPVNNPPEITSTPITGVDENVLYLYQVSATDADGDVLTYSLTVAPAWLSIDNSGLITGTAPEVATDTDFDVSVVVSDGTDTTTQSYVLTVDDIPLPVNNPPVITSVAITEVDENNVYSYQMMATDADGDVLTYSLSVAPAWLSIDNSGLITGTAPVVATDTDFNVEVVVSDGTDSDTQSYVLTVEDVPGLNNHPVITSTAVTSIDEGQSYIYQVTAIDVDGETLIYSLTQFPNWLSINSDSGLITGTAPEVVADTDFDVGVDVSDGTDSDTQSYVLTVEDVPGLNNHPVITSTPITEVNENALYEYQVVATDADGDALTYSLPVAPAWLSIDNSGLITGTAPEVATDTDFDVSVVVSDGTDTTTQSYVLTVEYVSKSTKKSPSTIKTPYDEFYEEKYLDQFKPKTIILDEEEVAAAEEESGTTVKQIAILLLVLIAVVLVICILLLIRNSG